MMCPPLLSICPWLLPALLLTSALASSAAALDSVKIDVADEYHIGDAFQLRIAVPAKAGDIQVLLQDPDGRLVSLLPNAYETVPEPRSRAFRWMLPQPGRGYDVVLGLSGSHRVISLHSRNGGLEKVVWPDRLPLEEASALSTLRESLLDAGPPLGSQELAISTHVFSVRADGRPEPELLPLSAEGILDGVDVPRFAPAKPRLAGTRDYRILWRWAALLRSPAHRHQTFLIECHSHQAGSRKNNLDLSEERARAVVNYLVEKAGIPSERLTAIGKGDFEPLPGIDDPADPAHERVALVLDQSASRQSLTR